MHAESVLRYMYMHILGVKHNNLPLPIMGIIIIGYVHMHTLDMHNDILLPLSVLCTYEEY